jgi:hypothetical protein
LLGFSSNPSRVLVAVRFADVVCRAQHPLAGHRQPGDRSLARPPPAAGAVEQARVPFHGGEVAPAARHRQRRRLPVAGLVGPLERFFGQRLDQGLAGAGVLCREVGPRAPPSHHCCASRHRGITQDRAEPLAVGQPPADFRAKLGLVGRRTVVFRHETVRAVGESLVDARFGKRRGIPFTPRRWFLSNRVCLQPGCPPGMVKAIAAARRPAALGPGSDLLRRVDRSRLGDGQACPLAADEMSGGGQIEGVQGAGPPRSSSHPLRVIVSIESQALLPSNPPPSLHRPHSSRSRDAQAGSNRSAWRAPPGPSCPRSRS